MKGTVRICFHCHRVSGSSNQAQTPTVRPLSCCLTAWKCHSLASGPIPPSKGTSEMVIPTVLVELVAKTLNQVND